MRAIVALAVIIGVAGGVTMAAVAGARRDGTAYARLLAKVSPSNVWVLANAPGFDWNLVRALPEVKILGEFPVSFYEVVDDQTGMLAGFPPASPESMRDIERPFIVQGRMPDPARFDEVLMTPSTRRLGYHLGQTVMLHGYRADRINEYFSAQGPARGAAFDGPLQSVRIVGVGKGSFFAGDDPQIEPTLAFFQKYRANILPSLAYINAVVRLRHGSADIPALRVDLQRLFGHPVE
ncbi:MAG: hypothetical protein M3N98_01560, partial [Actinomycetota bacterium]|nr:hypothetical protein [Actinomycetota bacterium]